LYDANRVYWQENGATKRVAYAARSARDLASGTTLETFTTSINQIAMDDGFLYVATDKQIVRVPKP
jgi:hypothetical protein